MMIFQFEEAVEAPKFRPTKNPKKPPIHPMARRDHQNGDLYFTVPYHIDFMEGFKGCVISTSREFIPELKTWRVDQKYAASIEDLLEAFFPDIIIDYMGWGGE